MPPGSVRLSDARRGQNLIVSDAPIDKPTDAMVRSEPLGDHDPVIEHEPTGPGVEASGGQYPDPDTPPAAGYGAPG